MLDPPLSGYEDVKPRLLEMKAIAQEGLGMVCTCLMISAATEINSVNTDQITRAHNLQVPPHGVHAHVFPRLRDDLLQILPQRQYRFSLHTGTLRVLVPRWHNSSGTLDIYVCNTCAGGHLHLHPCAQARRELPYGCTLFYFIIFLLTLRHLYHIHQAGYIIGTILFGFPIWVDMRRRIQAARIDSVMKIE